MGLTKHLHISNWVSLDWRLCENGGNSKPLIFFTSWSISAGHRVWNAAEHFETGSVFCVQNMTGTSHLKGLLSPGRLLTWRFTRERLVLIQYKYWVLHNTCNIITLIFIKDKQSLASKNTCVYICSSERASVRFVPRSRRISMLHGCIWIIFKALRRVQIYIKRWKCIPPREACDKKPYWNSMREIFLFFSFFPCEDQKWVMGLWESISQTIVFLMPRILTAPIIQSKGKRTLYPWDGGGGGNVWSRRCRMWIRRRGMETEAQRWASSWLFERQFEWSFTFPHPPTSDASPRPRVASSCVAPWQLHSPVSAMRHPCRRPCGRPSNTPFSSGLALFLVRSDQLVETPWKFVTACRWLAL